MDALTLGPFSFSSGLLSTFGAILATMLVGGWRGRAWGQAFERRLWWIIGTALLAARLAFVLRYLREYTAAPLSMLDIRDGGFDLAAGLCAGFALAAWLAWRERAQRGALLAAVGSGAGVFALAALLTLVIPRQQPGLPQVTFERLEGGELSLAVADARPVVLNLWASWCGPCRREMPALRQAQRDRPDVTFVFVNQGESPATILAFLRNQKLDLPNIVLDQQSGMGAALGSRALPTTLFFDSRGQLTGRRSGELSAATLAQQLDKMR